MKWFLKKNDSGSAREIFRTDSGSRFLPLCPPSSGREDALPVVRTPHLSFSDTLVRGKGAGKNKKQEG